MLASGYGGGAQFVPPMLGFVAGMCGWGFILFEIFVLGGAAEKGNKYVKQSFDTMRFIVTIGWSIYPLGYFMGAVNDSTLNLVYNLADFVNKIAFVLAIWSSAERENPQDRKITADDVGLKVGDLLAKY